MIRYNSTKIFNVTQLRGGAKKKKKKKIKKKKNKKKNNKDDIIYSQIGGFLKDAKKYLKKANKGDQDSQFELFVAARSIQNSYNKCDKKIKKELKDTLMNINSTLEFIINKK